MNTHRLDRAFPTVQHLIDVQESVNHALPASLKHYRMTAREIYEKLPHTVPSSTDWRSAPLPQVLWETAWMSDFYVTPIAFNDGVVLCDVRDFIRDYHEAAMQYLFAQDKQRGWVTKKMGAFIESCFNRAAVVWIPPSVHVVLPIDIAELLGGYRQHVIIEKIIVIVGAGSSVVINDTVHSCLISATTVMRSVDYYIGDNANVRIVHNQSWDNSVEELSRYAVYAGRDSVIDYTVLGTGGAVIKNWYDLFIDHENVHMNLQGLHALNADSVVDITTAQEHIAANSSSKVLFKGILNGQSRAVYRGTIFVQKGADGTNASQHAKHIILSDKARAWAMPSLEVLAHQVRCAHGSAVGSLDKEQLFYAQSRGMSFKRAQKILLMGFCTDVVRDITPELFTRIVHTLYGQDHA